VVFVYLHGRARWFRRINTVELFSAVLDYARMMIDDPACSVPALLGASSFSWTGGGIGPEPPISDMERTVTDGEPTR
jgi:hypothetical protein